MLLTRRWANSLTRGGHHWDFEEGAEQCPRRASIRRSRFQCCLSANWRAEKVERPEISHGQASQIKKGEDLIFIKTECQRVAGDGVSTYSVFALFDGHNGSAAAMYSKENLLNNVLAAVPSDLNRDEWVAALPRALVAGFVKTDKDLQERAQTSGTTVTFMIIEGWVITVASVGDSRCILESAEGEIYYLSADHRLECNVEERERITASGGEVGRLNTGGGTEFGPLRCWPGGLCLSRSIGDMDVGEFIVPVPYVKQVKVKVEVVDVAVVVAAVVEVVVAVVAEVDDVDVVEAVVLSTAGGRLIISSDGVWDALSAEVALDCCRGMPADAAASQIVKEAVQVKGLRDDTTCIVIDMQPPEKPTPTLPPPKKPGKGVFMSMFRKKPSESSSQTEKEYCEPDMVEELFEEGSAMLSERLDSKYPLCNMFKLFMCAVCQVELKPREGISIHADVSNSGKLRPWDGPFLCSTCQDKKEAMEGKRPSGALTIVPGLIIIKEAELSHCINPVFVFHRGV
ncbi:protein phosphatase 2C family protein [Actinidia rufa]|uniref:Protein phosphatase 2C family protein n=1 Tax=Actinidia rufa TaxID=165716 RepID=A0A7J0DDZ7_9ERIC|nr:protein phosphatase 2C family protein [Actinidia rufa]